VNYRVALQRLLLLRYPPTRSPSPARESATRRVEKMEIIRIANPRHSSKQTPLPEESRPYVSGLRDAPQVGAVQADGNQDGGREQKRRNHGPRVGIVGPIRGIEAVLPGNGVLLVIAVPVGIG
jgi:hypothetical protein